MQRVKALIPESSSCPALEGSFLLLEPQVRQNIFHKILIGMSHICALHARELGTLTFRYTVHIRNYGE